MYKDFPLSSRIILYFMTDNGKNTGTLIHFMQKRVKRHSIMLFGNHNLQLPDFPVQIAALNLDIFSGL